MANIIQAKTAENAVAKKEKAPNSALSVNAVLNSILDREGLRKRFDELLGKRTPQFISALISLVNADPTMQKCFYEAPMTVIQAGLKAASFDLPIDQNLGYAYIVPFKNNKKTESGEWVSKTEATFVIGWKGMHQLALRTGAYKTINVVDVREGELKSYNRLTEEIELEFIEDEDVREEKPVIGYVGYYRLVNGAEKTIYMTVKQIERHEKRFRKGKEMGKGWRDSWDDMARKTVYRRLIGKWGVMSVEYQSSKEGQSLADAMKEEYIDRDEVEYTVADADPDIATGEVKEEA